MALRAVHDGDDAGHVVLGRPECLDVTGTHELVHVRQYERWGRCSSPRICSAPRLFGFAAAMLIGIIRWSRGRREAPYLIGGLDFFCRDGAFS